MKRVLRIEEGKDQELIKSCTKPDPGHRIGKWKNHKKAPHTGEPNS